MEIQVRWDFAPRAACGKALWSAVWVVAAALIWPGGLVAQQPAAAPAPAPASAPQPADVPTDGPLFTVTEVQIEYEPENLSDFPGLPSTDQLEQVQVVLGRTAEAYVAPRRGVPSQIVR